MTIPAARTAVVAGTATLKGHLALALRDRSFDRWGVYWRRSRLFCSSRIWLQHVTCQRSVLCFGWRSGLTGANAVGIAENWPMGSRAEIPPEPQPWAVGPPVPAGPRTGSFRFWFATRRWEWSPEVYEMHGYTPGEVEPTTDLLLAHKHPDDREQVAEIISRSIAHGEPFSSRHRFIDVQGREHQVMVVADRILDSNSRPVGTAGFYIDLSSTIADAGQQALVAQLPGLMDARATIE
ncbi:PAS domain-containing protein [Nocardia tengchongensis]|uniref:PAS domain-containing protein n=1 Tax=Nocardia tengchongensis TaxID=2055889 RepID=UPI00364A5034